MGVAEQGKGAQRCMGGDPGGGWLSGGEIWGDAKAGSPDVRGCSGSGEGTYWGECKARCPYGRWVAGGDPTSERLHGARAGCGGDAQGWAISWGLVD